MTSRATRRVRISSIPGLILALAIAAVFGSMGSLVLLSGSSQTSFDRCSAPSISGTSGSDVLKGTKNADVIAGLGGNDTIRSKGGNDIVCGGEGDDAVDGGPGNDELDGGAGQNHLDGGAGTDLCVAGTSTRCERPPPSPSPSISGVAPTVTTTASTRTYVEDDGSDRAIDNQLTVSDPDSTQLQGATVRITSNFDPAEDELVMGNPDWVSGVYDDNSGTLTIFGVATVAQYQDALASASYHNSSDNPSGTKTISFQVTDTQGNQSNVATRTIQLIAVDG